MNFEEAIKRLKTGNEIYMRSETNFASIGESLRNELCQGQSPYACIVSCSDSRVVPEYIFSASLGELFSIRNAGNLVGDNEIASITFAVKSLGVKLVVIMGHTNCGAVKAAITGSAQGNLATITEKISDAIGGEKDIHICEEKNAKAGVDDVLADKELSKLAQNGEIKVISAIYDMKTGKVEFVDKNKILR